MGKTSPSSKTPLTSRSPRARATRQLRNFIASGELSVGEELASEVELAEGLGVSRGTVRAALANLEAEGLVRLDGRRRTVTRPDQTKIAPSGTVLVVSRCGDAGAAPRPEPGQRPFLHHGLIGRFHHEGFGTLVVSPEKFAGSDDPFDTATLHGVVAFPDSLANPAALDRLRRLRDGGTPVVLGDPADTEEFDVAWADHDSGCYQATKWLIDHGCKRPLRWWALAQHTLGRPRWLGDRDTGYDRAIREARLPRIEPVEYRVMGSRPGQPDEDTLRDNIRLAAGYLGERLQADPAIDALLLTTDSQIRTVVGALELCGRRPGRDVLIAGYDNCWAEPSAGSGPPTAPSMTVDKRNEAIGDSLAQLLLDRAGGKLPDETQVRWVEPELIVLCDAMVTR